MTLSDRLNQACASYFDTPPSTRAVMAGYDVSPRGTSLCFIRSDWSVLFYNIFSDSPPAKAPKSPSKAVIPRIPENEVHAYTLNAIAQTTKEYWPLRVVHEDYVLVSHGTSTLELTQLGQDVRRLLQNYPESYHLLHTMTMKAFVVNTIGGIKGKATKELMISVLSAKYGVIFTPTKTDNEADALGLAAWGMHNLLNQTDFKPTRFERILHKH